ncbi:DNA-processing protein DprA [Acinetobacter sp. TSRC1-2]|uniref:DNA-processing protein DprA n=1 Tax=unclassified Acinetobacter TaxID=196816 RepID=UPI003CF951F8
MLNSLSSVQLDYIRLWFLVQHSLTSFYKINAHYTHLAEATLPDQIETWQKLGIHKNHIQRLRDFHLAEAQLQFQHCVALIQKSSDFILTLDHPDYPTQLLPYADKPPLLFGQGDAQALLQPQVAMVGSRKPSSHGRQVTYDFAFYLSEKGFYIGSGLAEGIDEAAHQGALRHSRTIAVMGTGLDQTYPTQHQQLRQKIIAHSGTVVTEFLPGTPPLQHHFPRRNRIVSALSLGVIVAEATLKSGSLITAKLAAEQDKLVFAIPGHIYSEHHQGCHQLIREGAILVEHPEQVIEDLALPTQWHTQQHSEQTKNPNGMEIQTELPSHLTPLYNQLDWVGQNIDDIVAKQQSDIGTLTSQLMELELLGLCMQQAGLYLRCRPSK